MVTNKSHPLKPLFSPPKLQTIQILNKPIYKSKIHTYIIHSHNPKIKVMEDCMRECMKKLAIWYTRSFRPLLNHEELEPIMATLGFVGQPDTLAQNGVAWKEYVYAAGAVRSDLAVPLPRPKLPTQRIDGLHIYTYRAFIEAVNFYLEMDDISILFHIRGMPLHRVYDRNKKFRRMDGNESVFVYREGTLDQSTYNYYNVDKKEANNDADGNDQDSIIIRSRGNNLSIGSIVKLKDIIVLNLG